MTRTPWLTDDEQAVWRRFLDVQLRLQAELNRRLQERDGLSVADFGVLAMLSEADGERLRVTALADLLQWEKSRLSHQLTRMQRRGLVTKQACGEDGRGAYAVLTDAGRDAVRAAAPDHAETVRRLLFEPLDGARVSALGEALAAVQSRLDAEGGSRPER